MKDGGHDLVTALDGTNGTHRTYATHGSPTSCGIPNFVNAERDSNGLTFCGVIPRLTRAVNESSHRWLYCIRGVSLLLFEPNLNSRIVPQGWILLSR